MQSKTIISWSNHMTSLFIHHLSVPPGGHLLPEEHLCLYSCFPRCYGDFSYLYPIHQSHVTTCWKHTQQCWTNLPQSFAICRGTATDLAQFSSMTLNHSPPAGMLKDTLWALWTVWEGWKQLWDSHSWDSAVLETHCPPHARKMHLSSIKGLEDRQGKTWLLSGKTNLFCSKRSDV